MRMTFFMFALPTLFSHTFALHNKGDLTFDRLFFLTCSYLVKKCPFSLQLGMRLGRKFQQFV